MASGQGPRVFDTGMVRVSVNGFDTEAIVDRHLVDQVLMPRLVELAAARSSKPLGGRRTFVFLVAPPGAGKSTLAAVLLDRARHWPTGPVALDAVGIDGFHLPQAELEERGLATVKGAPETFDVAALACQLEAASTRDLAWPTYDRTLHDVVPGRRPVTAELVLVEGNWLLLDEPGWRDLASYSALTMFVDAQPELLRDRLVERKIRGGLSPAAAADFYERSDRLNVERVLTGSDRRKVDLMLQLNPDMTIEHIQHIKHIQHTEHTRQGERQ